MIRVSGALPGWQGTTNGDLQRYSSEEQAERCPKETDRKDDITLGKVLMTLRA